MAAVTRRVGFHSVNLGYRVRNQFVWLGELLVFVVKVVRAVPTVLRHYRRELWRLIAEVTFGGGVLAIAASTILVSAVLVSTVGVQLGIEGLQGLNIIGLAPLAGLLSAFANTRELAPLLAGYGLAAQMGCKFTAQIGAMQVNEEIDAMEVMSIPSLPYLVTTRLLAALAAVIPLYLLALSGAFLATQFAVLAIAHQGSGTYLHYFYLFLNRRDIFYSVLKVDRLRRPRHHHPLLLRDHRIWGTRRRRSGDRPGHPRQHRGHRHLRHVDDAPLLGGVGPGEGDGLSVAAPPARAAADGSGPGCQGTSELVVAVGRARRACWRRCWSGWWSSCSNPSAAHSRPTR